MQTDYREILSSRYGIDPVLASVIPLGTGKEMEHHARLIQQTIKATEKGGESTPEITAAASSRILSPVEAMLASKYKGPNGKG